MTLSTHARLYGLPLGGTNFIGGASSSPVLTLTAWSSPSLVSVNTGLIAKGPPAPRPPPGGAPAVCAAAPRAAAPRAAGAGAAGGPPGPRPLAGRGCSTGVAVKPPGHRNDGFCACGVSD